jgi:hypothetical protein
VAIDRTFGDARAHHDAAEDDRQDLGMPHSEARKASTDEAPCRR